MTEGSNIDHSGKAVESAPQSCKCLRRAHRKPDRTLGVSLIFQWKSVVQLDPCFYLGQKMLDVRRHRLHRCHLCFTPHIQTAFNCWLVKKRESKTCFTVLNGIESVCLRNRMKRIGNKQMLQPCKTRLITRISQSGMKIWYLFSLVPCLWKY